MTMHMVNKIVIRAGKCVRLCESSHRKLHNELLGQKRTMVLVELSCCRIGSVLIIDSVPKDALEAMSSLRQKLDDYCTRAVGLRTCNDDPGPLTVLPTQPMSKEITFSINYWPLLQLAAAMSARSIAAEPLLVICHPQHFLEHLQVDSIKDEVVKQVEKDVGCTFQKKHMKIETSDGRHHLQTDLLRQVWQHEGQSDWVRVNVVVSDSAKDALCQYCAAI